MKKRIYLTLILTTILTICMSLTACFFGNNISVEKEYLIADSTCYIGNYNCPKLYVTVKNTSSSNYLVWVEASFYYKGELACSEQSRNQTMTPNDSFTFEIQSSYGTKYFMDSDNWTYKITKIGTISK